MAGMWCAWYLGMNTPTKLATLHGRAVRVLSAPRHIAGGSVCTIAWDVDNDAMRLADGTIHPAHRAGFQWEEPVCNLVPR